MADDKIKVTLAHHLPADNPYTKKKQVPGDELTLNYNEAVMLANGAYIEGVNPGEPGAVENALGKGPAAASARAASAPGRPAATPAAAKE